MKLLVTGGAGYIGSVVSARLVEAGHQVVILDDLSTGHADAVPDGAQLVVGRIDDDAVVRPILADGVEAVLHFAAKSLVGESETLPEKYFANNVGGTLALLVSMMATGVTGLVFSSSCAVYGEPPTAGPLNEATPTRPESAYGASKLSADLLISAFTRAHGLGAVSLRYFNAAGAYGRFGERHTTETHLIPLALRTLTEPDRVLKIMGTDYATPDGTAIRDYIHILDLAAGHLIALNHLREHHPGIRAWNLGTGKGSTVFDMIKAFSTAVGRDLKYEVVGRRAGDVLDLTANPTRANKELGWKAKHTLEETCADLWRWTENNPQGYRQQPPKEFLDRLKEGRKN